MLELGGGVRAPYKVPLEKRDELSGTRPATSSGSVRRAQQARQ